MKPTHLISIILATGFGIFWCFMIWSAGQWPKTTLQGEGNGDFFEQNKRRAGAEAFAREVLLVSKRVGHRIVGDLRSAPPGVYFTLTELVVRHRSGITDLNAGTQVVSAKDKGPALLVKAGKLEFETERQYLTNDLDVAEDVIVRNGNGVYHYSFPTKTGLIGGDFTRPLTPQEQATIGQQIVGQNRQ
jgi:hypothetical protein